MTEWKQENKTLKQKYTAYFLFFSIKKIIFMYEGLTCYKNNY